MIITLPQFNPSAGSRANVVSRSPPSKTDGGERILVVDDEELVRMVIRAILTQRGYRVTEAEDGEAAVEQYLQAPDQFDLVLIDMNMPRLSGRDALIQMRQQYPNVRAIILSGGVEEPETEPMAGLQGVLFLRKPFDNQELLRTVRHCLDVPLPGR